MTTGRLGRWTTAIGLLLLAGVYVRALKFTPVEATQGLAQKIFYVHVPAAWSAMLAMGLVGVASILFLLLRDERYDRFAAASAEVGTVFSLVMLTTGPLWARPVWGTWWTWDACCAHADLLFSSAIGCAAASPRAGAAGAVLSRRRHLRTRLLPFIHLSVYLARTPSDRSS
jgi:heme exporter protein C